MASRARQTIAQPQSARQVSASNPSTERTANVTSRPAAAATPKTRTFANEAQALAAKPSKQGPDLEATEQRWSKFEQRRHLMSPPDLFDEARKRVEKFQDSEWTKQAKTAREPVEISVDLELRKARFFDRCLKADRSLESLALKLPGLAGAFQGPPYTARDRSPSPQRGVTPGPLDPVQRERFGGGKRPPNALPTMKEAMTGLVTNCRAAKLQPATTGLVRAEGDGRLHLNFGAMSDARAEAMCQSLRVSSTDVKEASFRSNGLTERGAKFLLQALPDSIKAIDLSQNDLAHNDGWCSNFMRMTSLQHLIVCDAQLGDNSCKDLCDALAPCKGLVTLKLSGNSISVSASSIGNLISNHKGVVELDVHWNLISGDSARDLIRGLIDNVLAGGKIRQLNLSWNPLGKIAGEETCKLLSQYFSETSCLLHLDISNCDLTAAQCHVLAHGLQENSSIVGMHVAGNEAKMTASGSLQPLGPTPKGDEASRSLNSTQGIAESSCCWMCEGWRETRICYANGISGPEAAEVWFYTSIDGFQTPTKMAQRGANFVSYVMAPPGSLLFAFQEFSRGIQEGTRLREGLCFDC